LYLPLRPPQFVLFLFAPTSPLFIFQRPPYSFSVEIPLKERTLSELKTLLKDIPKLGDEIESFERDLKEILEQQPGMPKEDRWA